MSITVRQLLAAALILLFAAPAAPASAQATEVESKLVLAVEHESEWLPSMQTTAGLRATDEGTDLEVCVRLFDRFEIAARHLVDLALRDAWSTHPDGATQGRGTELEARAEILQLLRADLALIVTHAVADASTHVDAEAAWRGTDAGLSLLIGVDLAPGAPWSIDANAMMLF